MGQRAGDFVVAGAVADLKHCTVKLFGKTHDYYKVAENFVMARATSNITMPTSRGVKSSLGATPHHHLAEPGVSHGQARDDHAVVERVHDHLSVSCWSCHSGGTIPYRKDRGQSG